MCGLRRKICPLLAVLGAMLSTTAGSHNSDPALISIDQEAFIHEVRGTPNALTRMSDGTLLVAGGLESAWAVALDAGGKVRWKFERSGEPGAPPGNQSVYHDAVQLANGNLLLCGEENSKQGGHALFTLLDRAGSLIQERQMLPKGVHAFYMSSFHQCFPWNGGIAVIGEGTTSSNGTQGWVLKLNADGNLLGERVDREVFASSAYASSNGSLVLASLDGNQTKVFTLDGDLKTGARRAIPSSGYGLLRPTNATSDIKLVAYQVALKAMLYSLGQDLQDKRGAQAIEPVYIDKGRGFALPDNSLALFGYIYMGGPYTAAMAHIDSGAQTTSLHAFYPGFAAFTVSDALPLGGGRFATVRSVAGKTAADSGIVVSWVTFK